MIEFGSTGMLPVSSLRVSFAKAREESGGQYTFVRLTHLLPASLMAIVWGSVPYLISSFTYLNIREFFRYVMKTPLSLFAQSERKGLPYPGIDGSERPGLKWDSWIMITSRSRSVALCLSSTLCLIYH